MTRRLSKADVESLLDALDTPQLVEALSVVLAKLLDLARFPDDWPAIVRLAGERAGWSDDRVASLAEEDPFALSALATDLNELRVLV